MRLLVVEDDESLLEAVCLDSQTWPGAVLTEVTAVNLQTSRTEHRALEILATHGADLVLMDVQLAEGSGLEVARRGRELQPSAVFVAISGKATASEGFRLAELGVTAYLAKPFTPDELRTAVRQAWQNRAGFADLARSAQVHVGRTPVHAVQDQLRSQMLHEALRRTGWNYVNTAKLLGVTRQAVQQMVVRFGLRRSEEESS